MDPFEALNVLQIFILRFQKVRHVDTIYSLNFPDIYVVFYFFPKSLWVLHGD